jgi:putative chitobiose transport system substrate-binding protein
MGTRRLASVAATAILSASLFAACAVGGGDEGSDSKAAPTGGTGEIKGDVSFQTWALKPKFTDYVQGVIDAFEKEHPGVKVKWLDQPGDGYDQKVLTQASSGDLPDVTNLPSDFAAPLAREGLLLNIAEADPSATSAFVPGGLDAYQYPGLDGTYGYPWYLGTDVNYWNTKLLKANGVDTESLPTDLDSLIADARVVTKNSGGKVYLMTRKPGLNDFVSAGIPIFNADGTAFAFNTPEAVALVQKYADAYHDGLLPRDVLTDTFQGNATLYNEEKGAWTTGGANISGLEEANPGLVPVTTFTPAFGTPPLYVQGLSVKAKSKNLSAAIALARWVTNAENQKEFAQLVPGIFPSTTESANDPFFSQNDGTPAGLAKVTAFKELSSAQANPPTFSPAMTTILDQQIALAISGKASAKDALDKAVEECTKLLSK